MTIIHNRTYFLDGQHLYYKKYIVIKSKVKVIYDEVPKIDGVYSKRYQSILRRLVEGKAGQFGEEDVATESVRGVW